MSNKKGVGRPTDYDPDFHPANLLAQAGYGQSVAQYCAAWGIGNTTFYEWIKKYPEFRDAYTRARPMINAYWLNKAENLIVESNVSRANHNVLKMLWSAHAVSGDDRALIIPGFADAANATEKRDCVLAALANGDITASEADRFLGVLERGLRIGEASELVQRLEALERQNGLQNAA